jgi:hypothetical protein
MYDGFSWTLEEASENNTIGLYGYDGAFPTYIQPSLDLGFDEFGQPTILHFNGYYTSIKDCAINNHVDRIYNQYRMDMNLFVRRGPSQWEEVLFPDLPYTGAQQCIGNGDRFGEFCKLLKRNDSTYYAVTSSLHNHELMLYRHVGDSMKGWTPFIMDRTSRLFSIEGRHVYESFGYVDAKLTEDSLLHLTYNISNHYGYARSTEANRLTYFYARINLNLIDSPNYEPFIYNRLPTQEGAFENTLNVIDDSTVFIAYFNRLTQENKTAITRDGGNSWTEKSINSRLTNGQLQSEVVGDTIFLLGYQVSSDQIWMGKKAITDSIWQESFITTTSVIGSNVSSQVKKVGNDDQIYVVAQLDGGDQMLYGERIGGNWDINPIELENRGIDQLALFLDELGDAHIVYESESENKLLLGEKVGSGGWTFETILDSVSIGNMSFNYENGNYHISYLDGNSGYLMYLKKLGSQNWVNSLVDSSSSIVGTGLSSTVDGQGGLHLSYIDDINLKVRYAYLPANGSWEIQDMTSDLEYFPKLTAIALDTSELASIVFSDGSKDTLFLIRQPQQGQFVTERVEGEYSDFSGGAIGYFVDDQNQEWVIYNYQTFIKDLRLFYRVKWGYWKQLNLTNNSAEISDVFNFHQSEKDFYIIGRKSRVGNTGLGMLYGENGLSVELESILAEEKLNVWPNPSQGILYLESKLLSASSASIDADVSIYDLQGHQVFHEKLKYVQDGEPIELDIRGMQAGLYLLQLHSSKGIQVEKILLNP